MQAGRRGVRPTAESHDDALLVRLHLVNAGADPRDENQAANQPKAGLQVEQRDQIGELRPVFSSRLMGSEPAGADGNFNRHYGSIARWDAPRVEMPPSVLPGTGCSADRSCRCRRRRNSSRLPDPNEMPAWTDRLD